MSTSVRLALAGCGTVGGALLTLLARHGPDIAARSGVRFHVASVLVRNTALGRPAALDRAVLTDSMDEFLRVPVDMVVETIGGLDDAAHIARSALARGQRLVTANKQLLRVMGPQLAAIARMHRHGGATLDFEAAVGGGVPIVRLLRESLAGHGLRRICGVLNGTTNYVLSRVERGASFEGALADAQRAGFAEADPSRDLDGHDAADKIALLAWLGFGVDPTALEVRTAGIAAGLMTDAVEAARRGRALRLVASAHLIGGRVVASVSPRVVPRGHAFAQAHGEENIIQLESESSSIVTVSGRGAGGSATASALLADILHSASPLP